MRTESGRRVLRLALASSLSAAVAVSFVATALCTGSASPPDVRAMAWFCLPWIIALTLLHAFFVGATVSRDALSSGSWGARTCLALAFLAIALECYLFVFSGWGFYTD